MVMGMVLSSCSAKSSVNPYSDGMKIELSNRPISGFENIVLILILME